MDKLRIPLFIIAAVLVVIALLTEIGSSTLLVAVPDTGTSLPAPGRGIASLALLDGLLTFTIGLVALSLIIRGRAQGRLQGVITLVVSLLVLSLALASILEAVRLLSVMLSLLLAVPFGTIEYFERYAEFDVKTARALLSLIMALKLLFAAALALSQPRFLQNKGLVLIVLTSFIANIIVVYLHGLVPRFLVSITDDIAAIVVSLLAIVWALVLLVGAIPAIIRALRAEPATR